MVLLLNHQADTANAVEFTGEAMAQSSRIAVVASSTVPGTAQAAQMIAQWPDQIPRPVLLVRQADPFGLPPLSRYQLKAISAEVGGVINVPYVFALRQLDVTTALTTSRRAARLARRLRHRLRELPAGTGSRP
ncbi:hypothetical protein AB0J43_05970 [Nonomuraea fuscirosea]